MTATAVILIVVAAAVIAILAGYLARERRSKRLRSRFGPEYEYVMREVGSRPRAEDALEKRERRMAKVQVRPLSHDDHDRFAEQWHDTQSHFVDNPSASIEEA